MSFLHCQRIDLNFTVLRPISRSTKTLIVHFQPLVFAIVEIQPVSDARMLFRQEFKISQLQCQSERGFN